MNTKLIMIGIVMLLIVIFFNMGMYLGRKGGFNKGWNAAIDVIPKGVLFNYTLDLLELKSDELPWYADDRPFYILKNPARSYNFSHGDGKSCDSLSIAEILPKKTVGVLCIKRPNQEGNNHMKCFFHSADLDGHCSGAIVKMKYSNCEMIGIDYGDEFPWDSIPIGSGETIFMVDFSLQPYSRMKRLAIQAGSLFWFDHHSTVIQEHEKAIKNGADYISGIQRSGIGACALVWVYLFKKRPLPLFVKLLAEYDVWNHEDVWTLPFQYGVKREKNTLPDNQEFWKSLFSLDNVRDIVNVGEIILDYQDTQNRQYAEACTFETELDGLKCLAVNKMLTNSKIFDSVWDNRKYDAMIVFGWKKGLWKIGLYSDKENINLGMIAKARGGGGHKLAAGFETDQLPFNLN